MKKFIAIILCILMLFTLCSCAAQNISEESSEPSGQSSSVSEQSSVTASSGESSSAPAATTGDVQITIVPPAGWEPNTGSVLPVQYMKNTASFMVKEESFSETTIDDVVVAAKAIFESAFDKVAFIGEPETITVSGLDARKIIFTCEVAGMQMKYEYVYLFVGSSVYAITFGDLQASFDSLSADYEQILSDISFK